MSEDHSTAPSLFTAVDASGRKLDVRLPSALDTLRLFKAAGPVLSLNEAWLGLASLASCVQCIDGVPVPAPSSELQIESIVAKLGDVGLEAVGKLFDKIRPAAVSEVLVGNSPGTPSSLIACT